MKDYYIDLRPGAIYHVFNRAIGQEKLFKCEENYRYFLQRYTHYIPPVAKTLSWCLLPNHFHFLIKVRSLKEIAEHYELKKARPLMDPLLAPDFIMERFSNFFNSYAKSFNKVYHRKGGLFIDYMRRKEVCTGLQLGRTFCYINQNPVRHGLVANAGHWAWSSYHEYFNGHRMLIDGDEALEWFGSREELLRFYKTYKV